MKFYHYTDKLFKKFKKRKGALIPSFKPSALWLSCNKDWPDFIERKFKYEYEFDIDISTLIVLETYNDIKEFTNKYGEKIDDYTVINWKNVKNDKYNGIFIKDAKIKKARKDFLWYSMIDICSVALWDASPISTLTIINK